jgi:hypothetical protein
MAGIGQVSPIRHIDNDDCRNGLQELFALTVPLISLTLERLSLAVGRMIGGENRPTQFYTHLHLGRY